MIHEILVQYFNEQEIKDFSFNVAQNWGSIKDYEMHIQYRSIKGDTIDILYIIHHAFLWNNTPEGNDYWNDIYNKIYYKTWQKKS